jgi:hypothetical protein
MSPRFPAKRFDVRYKNNDPRKWIVEALAAHCCRLHASSFISNREA